MLQQKPFSQIQNCMSEKSGNKQYMDANYISKLSLGVTSLKGWNNPTWEHFQIS
jgi:hypothetical protein